jgi:endonuclease YncB( thermonuclease family)
MEASVRKIGAISLMVTALLLSACSLLDDVPPNPEELATDAFGTSPTESSGITPDGDECDVTNIVDGDTIDVRCGEVGYRVRYIGVNTPERGESCYSDATQANADLVEGQRVLLVRDESNTDSFGRLLRYVYVGSTFVNEALVSGGWAEAVLYEPDDRHYENFLQIEKQATAQGAGCHPTGIFDDGSERR